MRTLCVGTTTNYTPKNKGMGFARRICETNAKPAIKTEKEKLVISSSLLLEIINGSLLNE